MPPSQDKQNPIPLPTKSEIGTWTLAEGSAFRTSLHRRGFVGKMAGNGEEREWQGTIQCGAVHGAVDIIIIIITVGPRQNRGRTLDEERGSYNAVTVSATVKSCRLRTSASTSTELNGSANVYTPSGSP